MRSAKATNVDLEGWACEVMEKITGKPHVRNRSSVSISTPFLQQAPPRPISRIDGPAPPPPRRPSAAEATPRRPSASTDAGRRPSASAESPTGERRQQSFPTRTSSHAAPRSTPSPLAGGSAGHERTGSGPDQRMMPPPPPNKPGTRSAGSSTSSLEAQREREKLDRESERERQRAYAIRQATIGFEGGKDGDKSEMKEKRRPPLTSSGGTGVANGWDRTR